MELLFASAIGVLTACGIYLILRQRTFPVILGLSLLSYAVNLFLFATGRLSVGAPPILQYGVETYTDPLPQALVLTAIVISFGMTAVIVMIALSAYLSENDDRIDMDNPSEPAKDDA
ncbi:Na+/H+ antiporter subunit C [Sulfitobacter sp. BDSS02]|uniref:Na+/H+ antiporter subunit C n=1 Tax=Roseobacteraceae TaxID=2854170 RepID=UPI000B526ED9|nr:MULTISPECIES: Na+/H+ antiporter subunit C [Roseobacteraceae]MBL3701850.1 Na+/H+ antiporter subunit C [Sulfitobacter sp. BDSS02]MBR9848200.1 Na+/H+ antiporter subunit C [Paracoccaceae bacterium]OWU79288.1 NADH-ubiquinone oxidoreductase subunit 4L [Phaeobacter sp. 22II1-1F12B]